MPDESVPSENLYREARQALGKPEPEVEAPAPELDPGAPDGETPARVSIIDRILAFILIAIVTWLALILPIGLVGLWLPESTEGIGTAVALLIIPVFIGWFVIPIAIAFAVAKGMGRRPSAGHDTPMSRLIRFTERMFSALKIRRPWWWLWF